MPPFFVYPNSFLYATVKCYEWFESRSRYYIVFEYAAKGEMFDKIVSAGHYTEEDSRKVLFALLVSSL